MPDAFSLYPAPPKQNEGLLSGNPSQIIDLVGKLNQNALFQKEFAAKQAVGNAFQGAIGADGAYDPLSAAGALRSNPDAAFAAPQAIGTMQDLLGKHIENQTRELDRKHKNVQVASEIFGTLSNKKNVSPMDIAEASARAAAAGVDASTIALLRKSLFRDPSKFKEGLATLNNLAIGPSGTSARVSGPPGEKGAPTTLSLGQANYAGSDGAGGGIQTGLGPGQGAAIEKSGASSADAAIRLRDAADVAPMLKSTLGNLEEHLNSFTAGPGADWTRVGKAFVNRNVPLPNSWKFDPQSIASQEEFNKQALNLAQQQFQTLGGTGTDAKFSSAFETNPHETLSHLGNQGVIRLLKGNQDAIVAKNQAWMNWKRQYGPDSYDEFAQDFNRRYDPRAFQFKYMTKTERQKYVDRMDTRDRAEFIDSLTHAHKQGMIKFDSPNGSKE